MFSKILNIICYNFIFKKWVKILVYILQNSIVLEHVFGGLYKYSVAMAAK